MAGTIKVQVLKDEGFTRILKCSEGIIVFGIRFGLPKWI